MYGVPSFRSKDLLKVHNFTPDWYALDCISTGICLSSKNVFEKLRGQAENIGH